MPVVFPVIDPVVSKRHIPDRHIKEVIRIFTSLVPADPDLRIRIQLPGNPAADIVKLHSIQLCAVHGRGQHSEKVPDPGRWLQHVPLGKPHVGKRLIHRPDDHRLRVMRIQDTAAGGSILLIRQQFSQGLAFLFPGIFSRVKSIRQPAPADITGKNILFFLCRGKAAVLQLFQETDRSDIPREFLFRTAKANPVVRNMVITGRDAGHGRLQFIFLNRFCVLDLLHTFRLLWNLFQSGCSLQGFRCFLNPCIF